MSLANSQAYQADIFYYAARHAQELGLETWEDFDHAGNIWNPDTEISHLIYNMLNPEF